MNWEKSVAIVTGAAGGIGGTFVRQLLSGGCRVVAIDKHSNKLEELAVACQAWHGALAIRPVDITNEAEIRATFTELSMHFGVPEILVNNAGVLRDGLLVKKEADNYVRKLPTAQWRGVLEANLTGTYLMSREFAAIRSQQAGEGVIVNISSVTSAGNPGQSAYAASKAGMDALTRTWALELADSHIRVVGIAPGLTDTPMARALPEAELDDMLKNIPLERMATPLEIWQGLRFALECDYFNGRILTIDGGAGFC